MANSPQQQLLDAIAVEARNPVVHAAFRSSARYGESELEPRGREPRRPTARSSSPLPASCGPGLGGRGATPGGAGGGAPRSSLRGSQPPATRST